MNKYYKQIDGHWVHRAPIKVIINPILRALQFWLDDPYVIATMTEWNEEHTIPNFMYYKFCRVRYRNFNQSS